MGMQARPPAAAPVPAGGAASPRPVYVEAGRSPAMDGELCAREWVPLGFAARKRRDGCVGSLGFRRFSHAQLGIRRSRVGPAPVDALSHARRWHAGPRRMPRRIRECLGRADLHPRTAGTVSRPNVTHSFAHPRAVSQVFASPKGACPKRSHIRRVCPSRLRTRRAPQPFAHPQSRASESRVSAGVPTGTPPDVPDQNRADDFLAHLCRWRFRERRSRKIVRSPA